MNNLLTNTLTLRLLFNSTLALGRDVSRCGCVTRCRAPRLATSLAPLALLLVTSTAQAHDGRFFTVEVVNSKLQAQGINGGADDGAPVVRPYINSMHDHWRNVESLDIAVADLPGFDVPHHVTPVVGYSLSLDWLGAYKWADAVPMPDSSVVPQIQPLDHGQLISITGPQDDVNSDSLGSIVLTPEVPAGGILDLDLFYSINSIPTDDIYILEFQMNALPVNGATAAIESSDSIYVLLSPDGTGPIERLHHASLFLESYVALNGITVVPEPSTAALALLLAFVAAVSLRCSAVRQLATARA